MGASKEALLWERNADRVRNSNVCIICLEPIAVGGGYVFDCEHMLHIHCFHKYFYYNYDIENNHIACPVCRQSIQVDVESGDGSRGERRPFRRWTRYLLMKGAAVSACLLLLCCGIVTTRDEDR